MSQLISKNVEVMPNGCWRLLNWKDPDGYTYIVMDGRRKRAHRAVYEYLVYPIEESNHIHHLCETTECINPCHLTSLTPPHHASLQRSGVALAGRGKTLCDHGHHMTPDNRGFVRTASGRTKSYCRVCARDMANLAAYRKRYQQRMEASRG